MIKNNKLTLEQAMNRIEEIIKKVEENKSSLPDTMQLYQEGVELIEFCRTQLDKAEEQVKIISIKNEKIELNDLME